MQTNSTGSGMLNFESVTYPAILAVVVSMQKLEAPWGFVLVAVALGALSMLSYVVWKTPPGQTWRFWAARGSVWAFNTLVLVGTVFWGVGSGS